MQGVNKVILIGRLGQDPELRVTPSGQQVCTLSLATSESWTKDGNKEERTEWHRVILWGKSAENASKYLKKGSGAYIEGKLQTRSWDDKEGQKRYTTEIIASSIQFIGDGKRANASDSSGDTNTEPLPANSGYAPTNGVFSSHQPRSTDLDDDVPF